MDPQINNNNRKVKQIEFSVFKDPRGSLTPIELHRDIPFDVKNISWARGENVHSVVENVCKRSSNLIIIALSGEVELVLDDNHLVLERPNVGLLMTGMSDLRFVKQSGNLICLVLSDDESFFSSEFDSREDLKTKGYLIDECVMIDLSCSKVVNIPFVIKRLFYIYDIPDNVIRGGHAHKTCHEVLVALNGSLEVELNDGYADSTVDLNNMSEGLFLPVGIWAKQARYKDKALCLVFASEAYSEDGYIDTYEDFIKYRKNEDTSI